MIFCHVDGGEDPKLRERDPFEALLALCRVCGIDYDIREHEGRWSCKLTPILDWPGDFYGGAGRQGGRRSWGSCNHENKLDALQSVIPMLFSSLHRCCTAWREIAKSHPGYRDWFQKDESRTAPPQTGEENIASPAPKSEKRIVDAVRQVLHVPSSDFRQCSCGWVPATTDAYMDWVKHVRVGK